MKYADLYIRVSTDEQADKGYSQRDQDERLRSHCQKNNISIGKVVYEDHSAKSFNRPAWTEYLQGLKKKKAHSNFILFTKWDRFSRNAGDAYHMISQLEKLGVTPQAIEQPLDMSIPENKLLLAIYLATPEVENDRRALNVFYGMRRAKKEGRLMGTAPYGYINRSTEDGKKYVAIKQPEASNIIWAFEEVAKGHIPAEHVRRKMNERDGKNMSRNGFIRAMRNPTYCGKIYLSQHKHEEAFCVKGKHEPLISETLFLKVQQIMDGRAYYEIPEAKVVNTEKYPLRGLLLCPRCGHILTASRSKGKKNYYHYYHCNSKCGFRHHSDKINELFEKELEKYEFSEAIKNLLKTLLKDNYKNFTGGIIDARKKLVQEIDEINLKVSKARDLYLLDKLDDDDYRQVKTECQKQTEVLEDKLRLMNAEGRETGISKKLDDALNTICNLSKLYAKADTEGKRAITCSMFPEKLVFDGTAFRTPRLNSIAEFIFLTNKALSKKKDRHKTSKVSNVSLVTPEGFEPPTVGAEIQYSIQLNYGAIL